MMMYQLLTTVSSNKVTAREGSGREHASGQGQRPSLPLSNCLQGHLPRKPSSEKCALCLKSPRGPDLAEAGSEEQSEQQT